LVQTAKSDILWRSHCHHLDDGRLIVAAHGPHQQSLTLRNGDRMVGKLPHSAVLQVSVGSVPKSHISRLFFGPALIQLKVLRRDPLKLMTSGRFFMDNKAIEAKLREMALELRSVVRMGDNDGWRLSVGNGAVIHNFDDGHLIIHGPGASALRLVLSALPKPSMASKPHTPSSDSRAPRSR
jgi:hypothetical protein